MSDGQWQVARAGGTDRDPRLVTALHVGPVAGVAWQEGTHPLLAVHTHDDEHRVRVWDVLSGTAEDLPTVPGPVFRMAFATMAGAPVLVTAHHSAGLRIWSVAGRLIAAVPVGDFPAVDLHLVETGGRLRAVTLDNRGRVHRWSLPDGARLGGLDAPRTPVLWSGRRADGRTVLLTGGEQMSLWDLADGIRLPLSVPAEVRRARSVMLAVAGGRDRVTVTADHHTIVTFDPETGELLAPPVTAHVKRPGGALTQIWDPGRPPANLAVAGGVLAVPVAWQIRLGQGPPLIGPVGHSRVQTVRYEGRELLLTAAAYDGVVALWDLDRPVQRGPGHEQRVSAVAVTGDVVVSVDEGGTLLARGPGGGLLTAPLVTGIGGTRALAAWHDGASIMAATGGGSDTLGDGHLRRWNVTLGAPEGPPVRAHPKYVHSISRLGDTLVTFGPGGVLKLRRPADGALLAEVPTASTSATTGFATGILGGRPFAAVSSYAHPLTLVALDDPVAPAVVVPRAGDDVVLAVAGDRIIVAAFAGGRVRPRTLRAWTPAGEPAGPGVTGPADIVGVAERAWPEVYVARADRTVALLDLVTGREVCPPVRLAQRPGPLAVTQDGDLVVAFGSDVARLRPPG